MKKISEEQKDIVVNLYKETRLQNYEIARICNISNGSIFKILKERGIEPKSLFDDSKDVVDKAVNMYEMGYEVNVIKEQCKIPQNRLYTAIDARGIKRRKCIYTQARNIHVNPKRKEVLLEYQKGSSFSGISRKLGISENTVSRYVKQAIKDGEIEVSERYSTEENNYIKKVAELIVKSKKKLLIREVAQAFQIDEQKLYYRVAKVKNK